MKKTGFYIIKDKFFEDMSDPYLKGNKAGNRPHYYGYSCAGVPLFRRNGPEYSIITALRIQVSGYTG